jgi:hypothetical protein
MLRQIIFGLLPLERRTAEGVLDLLREPMGVPDGWDPPLEPWEPILGHDAIEKYYLGLAEHAAHPTAQLMVIHGGATKRRN